MSQPPSQNYSQQPNVPHYQQEMHQQQYPNFPQPQIIPPQYTSTPQVSHQGPQVYYPNGYSQVPQNAPQYQQTQTQTLPPSFIAAVESLSPEAADFLSQPASAPVIDQATSLYIKGSQTGNFHELLSFLPTIGLSKLIMEKISKILSSHSRVIRIEYDATAELEARQAKMNEAARLAGIEKKITASTERATEYRIAESVRKTQADIAQFTAVAASVVMPDVNAQEIAIFKNVRVREQVITSAKMLDKAIALGCLKINEDGSKTWLV